MYMKILKISMVFFLVLVVLFANLISAEERVIKESKRNDFNARLEHIMCRIELTQGQLELLSSVNSSLILYKDTLDEDLAKLKEFADAANQKEFGNYFTTTLKNNLRNAVTAVKNAKIQFRRSNLTQDEKKTLIDNHKSAIVEFSDCVNEADNNFAEARASYLSAWISKWNKIIERMKESGYNTDEMKSVVNEAESKLLPALEKIKDAYNKEERKRSMQDARNIHLHLWARFEIARMEAYLKSIEEEAIASGYKEDFSIIKNKLGAISRLAVAGKKYGQGEFDTVWKTIKETNDMLKELNKKLR